MQNILAHSPTVPRTTDDPEFKNFAQQQHPTTRALLVHISGAETAVSPQTDALTDAELRATPVAVDGPLTDAELRATPVPVSGPVTDTELRATPVRTAASPESSSIYSGTTAMTPKFAIIDHNTNGDNTLVAAVASRKIRVLALMMISGGTVNARFESGASGTALSGQMQLTAQSGFTLPFNPAGWFETASGSLLNLELSAGVSVDGMLTYVEVP